MDSRTFAAEAQAAHRYRLYRWLVNFFPIGYDQGMMSGVCNAKNYIELIAFGHAEAIGGSVNTPAITNSLL